MLLIGGLLTVLIVGMAIFDYIPGFAVPNVRNQQLQSFRYGRGGDMNGSLHGILVSRKSGQTKVAVSRAKGHWEEPKTVEYLVEDQLLKDIEALFWKYRMDRWHEKKFSDIFVADGASYSYRFAFEEDDIWFSSQLYPPEYSTKLKEIHQLIEEYCQKGQVLPAKEEK